MAWVWNPELPCGFQFVQLCRHFIEEDPPRLDLFKTRQSLLLRDMELCCKLSTKLIKDLRYDNLWEAYVNQESRISPILAKMELVGIEFDNEALLACEQKIHQRLSQLQIEAEKVCGFFVQLSSAKQVSQALFDRLKLQPETQRDSTLKSGGISTGESVLKSISNQHPLPRLVLEYRHLSKVTLTPFRHYFSNLTVFYCNQ
jgi:DNA polymerase-1